MTPREQKELPAQIQALTASVEALRAELGSKHQCGEPCPLSAGSINDMVSDLVDEKLGVDHTKQHEALQEFIDFWADVKRETRSHFLKAILGLVTLAFAAGFVMLIMGRRVQ